MTKQIGLSAANFLLLAGGHLRRAKEQLDQEPRSAPVHSASMETIYAIISVEHALELLKEDEQ